MDILLVSPRLPASIFNHKSIINKIIIKTFSAPKSATLPLLAALISEENHVEVVDETFSKIDYDMSYDLVGITVITPVAPRAYQIADEFRRRGVKVVLGGWHVTALPGEAKQHADAVVIGEAELSLPKLLRDLKKGKLKTFYKNESPVDLKHIPISKRTVYQDYNFSANLQATRGCPMGCEFCNITNSTEGHVFRMRPIENVIEEIKSIKTKNIWFYDPSLTINLNYTTKLFNEMKNLGKRFGAFGNIDKLEQNDDFLKLASEAGCHTWFVGFESFSQDTINKIGKKSNKVKMYASAVKKIHDYGMNIIGGFIFGFDTDTKNVFRNTIDAINKLEIDCPEFTILTPYPGTSIFNRLEKERRILTYDWSKYSEVKNVVFQPKNMTPKELLDRFEWVIKETYSLSGLIKRLFNSKRFNLANIASNLYQYSWYNNAT